MSYLRQGGLFERSGIGDYDKTGDWSWEFYPPPYDFLGPANPAVMPAPIILTPQGLGGCGCGGGCKGRGDCGSHAGGLGLFDTMDFSQWGLGEWAAVGVGAYLLFSVLGDFGRAKKKVGRYTRGRRSKAARRTRLQQELAAA